MRLSIGLDALALADSVRHLVSPFAFDRSRASGAKIKTCATDNIALQLGTSPRNYIRCLFSAVCRASGRWRRAKAYVALWLITRNRAGRSSTRGFLAGARPVGAGAGSLAGVTWRAAPDSFGRGLRRFCGVL